MRMVDIHQLKVASITIKFESQVLCLYDRTQVKLPKVQNKFSTKCYENCSYIIDPTVEFLTGKTRRREERSVLVLENNEQIRFSFDDDADDYEDLWMFSKPLEGTLSSYFTIQGTLFFKCFKYKICVKNKSWKYCLIFVEKNKRNFTQRILDQERLCR